MIEEMASCLIIRQFFCFLIVKCLYWTTVDFVSYNKVSMLEEISMKKMVAIAAMIITLISLGACTQNKKESSKGSEKTSMSSQKDQVTDETYKSENKEKSQSIFIAVLVEEAKKNDTVDQSTRLVLKDVKAVEDPEKILDTMKNDGVILNVSKEHFVEGTEESDLKTGDKIQFTLVVLPAMTMSIPPQVAGNSVVKVEKI